MTNALATTDQTGRTLPAIAPSGPMNDALARLTEWVGAAAQAETLVRSLVKSAFVPEGYKVRTPPNAKPEQIAEAEEVAVANGTAAVLLGLGIGVDPLTALQQIIIIRNRPSSYAKFKVALLLSRGYDIWDGEITDESATVYGLRPGDDKVRHVTITMEQAKRAGWTTNEAYAKTPQDMLWNRAAGRLCDRIGGNVLLGIPTVDDVHDEPLRVDAQVGRVTADVILAGAEPTPRPAKRTRKAAASKAEQLERTTPQTDGMHDVDPDPVADRTQPVDEGSAQRPSIPPSGPPTQEAMKAMFAGLKAAGKTDRDEALEFIRQTIGRTVISRAELSANEVAAVIDRLAGDVLDEAEAAQDADALGRNDR